MSIWDDLEVKIDKADREVLDKYPEIRKSVEELETKYVATDTQLKKWDTWRNNTQWDDQAGMPKPAKERIDALQTRVSELESRGEIDMNWDEMQGKVKETVAAALDERGAFTKEKFEKEILPNVATADGLKNLDKGMTFAYAKTAHLPMKYFKEFGDDSFTIETLFDHMNKNGITDFDKAYDSLVAPKRQEITGKKHQQEIEAAEKRGAEKAKLELSQGKDGQVIVDQRGGSPEMGWYQAKKLEQQKAAESSKGADLALGSGGPAHAAYQAWLEGQRSKTVQ